MWPSIRPVVLHAELLEKIEANMLLAALTRTAPAPQFSANFFNDAASRIVKAVVVLVGDDAMEVAGNGAHIPINRPLIVVENNDETLGLFSNIVERFERKCRS